MTGPAQIHVGKGTGLRRLAWAAMLVAALCPPASAMTLAEAVEAARLHDPQFQAARHELDSAREGVPIARASLLPQVSLSYSDAYVNGTRQFPNAVGQQVTTRVDYASPQAGLFMRMPLFNYEAWTRLDQAGAQVTGAEANYRARSLDLVDRVTTAYLQTLEARAQITLAEAEVPALQAQLQRAQQRLLRGEGTRTEVAVAESTLETARVRRVDAQEKLMLALSALRRLAGRSPDWVHDTAPEFLPRPSEPTDLRDWMDTALAHNPVVQVRRATVEVTRLGVRRNLAGHLPRVDIVGSVTRNRNESLSNLDQTSRLTSVGVQLSIPLYSGGGVDASVRQAEYDRLRAEEELRNERENLTLNVQRLLQQADNAALRIEALRKAVAASEIALTGLSRAQELGLATQADVLDGRSRLYAVRRDLAQAQYEHLIARTRLMVVAGEPLQRIVERIDALLVTRVELRGFASTASLP